MKLLVIMTAFFTACFADVFGYIGETVLAQAFSTKFVIKVLMETFWLSSKFKPYILDYREAL